MSANHRTPPPKSGRTSPSHEFPAAPCSAYRRSITVDACNVCYTAVIYVCDISLQDFSTDSTISRRHKTAYSLLSVLCHQFSGRQKADRHTRPLRLICRTSIHRLPHRRTSCSLFARTDFCRYAYFTALRLSDAWYAYARLNFAHTPRSLSSRPSKPSGAQDPQALP